MVSPTSFLRRCNYEKYIWLDLFVTFLESFFVQPAYLASDEYKQEDEESKQGKNVQQEVLRPGKHFFPKQLASKSETFFECHQCKS